jgi:hypothetical protein
VVAHRWNKGQGGNVQRGNWQLAGISKEFVNYYFLGKNLGV